MATEAMQRGDRAEERGKKGREQESLRENQGSQDCNKDGARWGKRPQAALVLPDA